MERRCELDFLRGVAAFGIVGCHLLLSPRTGAGWMLTNLCDMNVGIFAALSGYLMAYGRWNGCGDYVRKRVERILPVYVVWTVFYLLFSVCFQLCEGGAVSPRYGDFEWWVRVVFWGSSATHLWFLASLFYAQIVGAVIFRRMPGLFWIGMSLVVILTSVCLNNWYVKYPIRLFSFLMLGYGLSSVEVMWLRRHRLFILITAGLAVLAHFIPSPQQIGFVKDWVVVFPVLLAFVARPDCFTGRLAAVGSFLGVTSMGVYLIHPIFTKGIGLIVRRVFGAPYGFLPVIADWSVSWICAMAVTVVLLRFHKLARFVR